MKEDNLPPEPRLVEVSVSACLASSVLGAIESEPKPRDSTVAEPRSEAEGDDA